MGIEKKNLELNLELSRISERPFGLSQAFATGISAIFVVYLGVLLFCFIA